MKIEINWLRPKYDETWEPEDEDLPGSVVIPDDCNRDPDLIWKFLITWSKETYDWEIESWYWPECWSID